MTQSAQEPLIIPREQHTVSRKNISKNALRVLYRLHETGHHAYLVGGAVRDLLLGGLPKDFDIATDATPEQVRALFRNCRLIGRRFRLAHVLFGDEVIEVATFRGTSEDGEGDRHLVDGRIVRDNVYGTLDEDAIRRDFTVNALYYGIPDFAVRDYVGGMQDIAARRLRLIGDPELRYREDPVRMLRALRLAAKLDFTIEAETAEPIPRLRSLLEDVAPARLFDEVLKMFLAGHGAASLDWLERYGLFEVLFPETARALAGDTGPAARALLQAALANTDARVREGKSVTPAFLFAALLWPALCLRLGTRDVGELDQETILAASEHVIAIQVRTVGLPRRFASTMQEIWGMQVRFPARQRKRVFRLLAHPRFRAGYDFLGLRVTEDPALKELFDWWTHAQTIPGEALAAQIGQLPAPVATAPGEDKPAPAGKRRRRRRSTKRRGGQGKPTEDASA